MNVARIIPREYKMFYEYINGTDDEQSSVDIHGFTIRPVNAKGKIDYSSNEGVQTIKNEPMYRRWDWTADESSKWSAFRKDYGELYKRLEALNTAPDGALKGKLEQCITDFVSFNVESDLLNRMADAMHTTEHQMKLFKVKQDLLVIDTSLGKISLLYDSDRPLVAAEKKYLEKYKALQELVFAEWEQSKWMRGRIKEVRAMLPGFWKRFYDLSDEADKATHRLFIPPPTMKGAISDIVSMYIPTAEESQKLVDDLNKHLNEYISDVRAAGASLDEVFAIFKKEEEESDSVFEEIRHFQSKLFDVKKASLSYMSVSDEFDDFLGRITDITKERELAGDDWEEYVAEQKLLTDAINQFIKMLTRENDGGNKPVPVVDVSQGDAAPSETDDLRAETISRYEADLKLHTNTYFDVADWHIILDHYGNKYDLKSKGEALKKAMAQHPQDPALMIRMAQEEAGEHRYREALDLLKQAEAMGPPHPQLLYTKANIYLNLQTPELAIPLYKKLASQKDKKLEWWRVNSISCLVDIYEGKKKYDECIKLCREVLEMEPATDLNVSRLAFFLRMDNRFEEAEQVLSSFIKEHPESAKCLVQLGHLYDTLKQHQKAVECFDKAYRLDPDENYDSLSSKGKSLMELKRFGEAATCFELCILHFKLEKNFHLKAAQCYAQLNLPHVAAIHYRRVLVMDPDSREAMEALQEMKKEPTKSPLS